MAAKKPDTNNVDAANTLPPLLGGGELPNHSTIKSKAFTCAFFLFMPLLFCLQEYLLAVQKSGDWSIKEDFGYDFAGNYVAGMICTWIPWIALLRERKGWKGILVGIILCSGIAVLESGLAFGCLHLTMYEEIPNSNGLAFFYLGLLAVFLIFNFRNQRWRGGRESRFSMLQEFLMFIGCMLCFVPLVNLNGWADIISLWNHTLFAFVFAAVAVLFAMLRLGAQPQPIPTGVPLGRVRWQAKGLVKSASNLTNLVLLVTVFSCYCSLRYEKDLDDLARIRTAFVDDLMAPCIFNNQAKVEYSADKAVAIGEGWLAEWRKCSSAQSDWPNDLKVKAIRPIKHSAGQFDPFGRGPSQPTVEFSVTIQETKDNKTWIGTTALNWPIQHVESDRSRNSETLAAAESSVSGPAKPSDFWRIFQSSENEILAHAVDLPGVNVSLPTRLAAWLGFLAVCPLLWFLSDRARLLASIPDDGAEHEQWMLFDAQGRLTKAVSLLCILVLLLAPWILLGLEVRITDLHIAAYGATPLGAPAELWAVSITIMTCLAWFTTRIAFNAWRDLKAYFR